MKFGLKTILAGIALTIALAAAAPAAPRELVFKDDRTLGDPKAPVVVVEYLAPTCPHCAHFATTVLPELKKHYIDTGKVLYVIRIFPLSAIDGAVAGMAKCMPPGRYVEFLETAFRKQAMWDPDGYEIADIKAALVQLGGLGGLKPDEAHRCMQDKDEFERINRIASDGADRFKIVAVPTLVIDGKVVPHETMSFAALKTRIDTLLDEAEIAPAPKSPQKIVKPKPRPKSGHLKSPKRKAVKHVKPLHKNVKIHKSAKTGKTVKAKKTKTP